MKSSGELSSKSNQEAPSPKTLRLLVELGGLVCQVWRTHRLFRCCLLFLLLGAVFNINRKLGLILVIGFVDISVELEF